MINTLTLAVMFSATGLIFSWTLETVFGIQQPRGSWALIGLSVGATWFMILWAVVHGAKIAISAK